MIHLMSLLGNNVTPVAMPPRPSLPPPTTATSAPARPANNGGIRLADREAIQKKKFWLEFRLEKRIEIPFLFRDMSKLPIFEHFLSVGNLKPKRKWFFKPKLKPKLFY